LKEADMKKTRKAPRSVAKLSTLDELLKADGKLEEFEAVAIKEVLAWQLADAMRAGKISRKGLAERMGKPKSSQPLA
jgi:antitoxin HicB